jgi:hypothetical protein
MLYYDIILLMLESISFSLEVESFYLDQYFYIDYYIYVL